ncbi:MULTISPECIES: transcriptional regulator [Sporosarcina]|uniref:Transcriptional regulator n=1 Tax=Sporosarcina saromensis TaxID=359365 RepID=A0ABU4GE22_9BACL|nr:transcriptional regulator [Sporosarcina saromensis]MDW0115151.1 transcriptional regulator [Sporosarcina saromensis]
MREKNVRKIIDKMPKEIVNEIEHTTVHLEPERGEFVYVSTKRYVTSHEAVNIREAMMVGYVEMSQINLRIAKECLHAELEAQHTMERLVSGG